MFVGKPLWQQIPGANPENLREKQQFAIRHPAQLRLQLAHGTQTDIPAQQLQLLGEHRLSPTFPDAKFLNLGADYV